MSYAIYNPSKVRLLTRNIANYCTEVKKIKLKPYFNNKDIEMVRDQKLPTEIKAFAPFPAKITKSNGDVEYCYVLFGVKTKNTSGHTSLYDHYEPPSGGQPEKGDFIALSCPDFDDDQGGKLDPL